MELCPYRQSRISIRPCCYSDGVPNFGLFSGRRFKRSDVKFFRFSRAPRWVAAGLALLAAHAAAAKDPKFSSIEAAAQYHVMAGELAALRQMPERAAEEFLKAVEFAADADLAMRAASLALNAGNEPLALKAARRWQALAPTEADPREAVARLALRAGHRSEAQAQCEALIKGHAGGPDEGFRQVAHLLSQETGQREDALVIMEKLRRQWPEQAGAYYAQSLLALRFDNLDLAEHAARESLRLKPGGREALLLLTGVLVKKGDIAAADRTIAELLKDSDNPAELRMGYARLLIEASRYDEARQQFEAALATKPDYHEARYALGLLALEREDFDRAELQFSALLESSTHQSQATYYLGRIEESRHQLLAALKRYEQVKDGEQAIDAVVRRAVVLGKLKRLDEGLTLLTGMREQLPALATRFYLAEGEILLDAGQSDQALAMYQRALDESPGNADLLYGRSLAHERMKQIDLAETDLRAILKQDPDDARAMNALGYMLTVHTQRLSEARKLIARALELSPDDAAMIDSLGWVEFRLGKVQEARALLEKAFDKVKDPEIAAHLGEVLWTLGDKERARAIWNAALVKDPEHKVLRETIDRFAH